MTDARRRVDSTDAATHRSSLRADIQGLRAIAVLGVVLWHVDPRSVPGGFVGVDAFFVISGYLMTRILTRGDGPLTGAGLARFYARRCRRILPAAVAILLLILLLSGFVLDPIRRPGIGGDVLAAAVFLVNWRFAVGETDYLAQGASVSPVQHYWSLAVEEQFYLGWPLILLVVGYAASWATRLARGRSGADARDARIWPRTRAVATGAACLAVGVPSLLYAEMMTRTDTAAAYFVTTTRVWELALGGLVVAVTPWLGRLGRRTAAVLGWAGLVVLLGSLFRITVDSLVPGYVALWPTMGTALVIAAGTPHRSTRGQARDGIGPERVLRWRPVVFVGTISYSLYLVHWPAVVLVDPYQRGLTLASPTGLAVLAASILVGWLSWRCVEEPTRRIPVRRPTPWLATGLALSAAGALAGTLFTQATASAAEATRAAARRVQQTDPWSAADALAVAAEPGAGAAALGADPDTSSAGEIDDDPGPFRPNAAQATGDLPFSYAKKCHASTGDARALHCDLGTSGPLVAVVGDSHAAQWIPAVQRLATRHGWRLTTLTKSSCPLTTAAIAKWNLPTEDGSCRQWNEAVRDELLRRGPDLVITSNYEIRVMVDGTRLRGDAARAAAGTGTAQAWSPLLDAGIPVLAIRDTPAPRFPIAECVAAQPQRLSRCAFDRGRGLDDTGTGQTEALAAEPRARFVDVNAVVCPGRTCPAVIGDVLVYRDEHHLTATYAATLADRLEPAVLAALRRTTPTP